MNVLQYHSGVGASTWWGGCNWSWFRWHEAAKKGMHIVSMYVDDGGEFNGLFDAVTDDFGNLVGVSK